jgi:hypothetical protein
MILLSKNEAQAKAWIQKIKEDRQDVADAANDAKRDLEALNKSAVTLEHITDLLAIGNETQLAVELFSAWKVKKGIDLPLSLIRTNDQEAWPPEIKKAFYSIQLLQGMSSDLSKYWDAKKKTFATIPLSEPEKRSIFEHFVEYVSSTRKKEQFEFMRIQAELVNDYNTAPHTIDSPTNQITPVKMREMFPHYNHLLKYEKEGVNPKMGKKGYFAYEVDKQKFVSQSPRPQIFI